MGALVRAQPMMLKPARETWEHAGLRCAIMAGPLGGWNGYVQLPPGSTWRRAGWMETPVGDLTYGPDPDGWVGFDTGHAWDSWAPDDDSPPYVPEWWAAYGPPGDTAGGELVDTALASLQRTRRLIAASYPGAQTWTLPRLRAAVDELAERLAVAGG